MTIVDFSQHASPTADKTRAAFVYRVFPGFGLWEVTAAIFLVNAIWLSLSDRLSAPGDWFARSCITFALAIGLAKLTEHFERKNFKHGIKIAKLLAFMLWIAVSVNQLRYLNYLTFSLALPLQDQLLQSADQAFGFDWLAYATWIAESTFVKTIIFYAYFGADFVVPGLIATLSILMGRGERAIELAKLLTSTALIAVLVGAFFPAVSATSLHATDALRQMLPSIAGDYHLKEMMAMRGTGPFVFQGQLPGLVTFPSFHTTAALVCMYCSRGTLPGFAAGTAFALATVASTPVMGGHYLIDVIAGAVLALVAILLLRSLNASRQEHAGAFPTR